MLADDCRAHRDRFMCQDSLDRVVFVLTLLTMSWAFVYFGLYFVYLGRSVYKLRSLARQDHKLANLMVKLQACPSPRLN